jgi:hypothetical protein
MRLQLPQPLADYFAAENADDADALARCFADNAVVRDEGRTIEGTAAIKRWMEEAKQKYRHTVEPLGFVHRDGKVVVTSKVSGNFPNSPVKLEQSFGLAGGKITSLEIRLARA